LCGITSRHFVSIRSHEGLYIACLDGNRNDETNPPFGLKTNVAKIHDQINHIASLIPAGYVPGPGTQDDWLARSRDGITGSVYFTWKSMQTIEQAPFDEAILRGVPGGMFGGRLLSHR
jgi:hypothetical protein